MSFSPLAKDTILANASEAYIQCEMRRRAEAYALLKQLQEERDERISASAAAVISSSVERPQSPTPDSPQQTLNVEYNTASTVAKQILIDSGYKFP